MSKSIIELVFSGILLGRIWSTLSKVNLFSITNYNWVVWRCNSTRTASSSASTTAATSLRYSCVSKIVCQRAYCWTENTTSSSSSKAPNVNALFAELNKGDAITQGLKKVTADMKSKNRADRSGHVTDQPKRETSARTEVGDPTGLHRRSWEIHRAGSS